MPKVYNKYHKDAPEEAVYIGRGSPYGNRFSHIKPSAQHPDTIHVSSRAEAIRMFKEHQLPSLDLSGLEGKDLVCFCKPLPCHGDEILKEVKRRQKQ